jgi:hypothetical protein
MGKGVFVSTLHFPREVKYWYGDCCMVCHHSTKDYLTDELIMDGFCGCMKFNTRVHLSGVCSLYMRNIPMLRGMKGKVCDDSYHDHRDEEAI